MSTGRLIGPSKALAVLRDHIRKFASIDAPALIPGETGTGKDPVPQAPPRERRRRPQPFLAVTCGSSRIAPGKRAVRTRAGRLHRRGTPGVCSRPGTARCSSTSSAKSPAAEAALLRVLGRARSRSDTTACRPSLPRHRRDQRRRRKGRGRHVRKDLWFHRLTLQSRRCRSARQTFFRWRAISWTWGATPRIPSFLSFEQALRRRNWPGNVRELKNEMERLRLQFGQGPLRRPGSGARASPVRKRNPPRTGPSSSVTASPAPTGSPAGLSRAPQDDAQGDRAPTGCLERHGHTRPEGPLPRGSVGR